MMSDEGEFVQGEEEPNLQDSGEGRANNPPSNGGIRDMVYLYYLFTFMLLSTKFEKITADSSGALFRKALSN